jgi:hypothetical protein
VTGFAFLLDATALVAEWRGQAGDDVRRAAFGSVERWAGLDSNQGPTDYESAALTN